MEKEYGITYSKPEVFRLTETGIGAAEIAARTAYDSFDQAENSDIRQMGTLLKVNADSDNADIMEYSKKLQETEDSELLDKLAWTYFHHSVLEHAVLTFYVKGISRGVLQELARHRIASYTVRSTRYTMSDIINVFVASQYSQHPRTWFARVLTSMNLLVTQDDWYNMMEWETAYKKLSGQKNAIGNEKWFDLCLSKEGKSILSNLKQTDSDANIVFKLLQNAKKKRNIGDPFKHIVTDNWKVDLVMTFNIRSLKNFFDLRDSGAAWFQMQWLAKRVKKATPKKYQKLIVKS